MKIDRYDSATLPKFRLWISLLDDLRPIPAGAVRGFTVYVNGEKLDDDVDFTTAGEFAAPMALGFVADARYAAIDAAATRRMAANFLGRPAPGAGNAGNAADADADAHASAYARAGIPVLPLIPGQKHPATSHGKDDATTDLEKIERWWTRRPQCNIGVRPQHGLVVLDVDVQHGGPAFMAALLDRYGPLPSTWMARTGQGGQHIWLRCGGPFRGKLGPGVDVKSHSGYLVAPPSIHPTARVRPRRP
jgi:hypothetical protein